MKQKSEIRRLEIRRKSEIRGPKCFFKLEEAGASCRRRQGFMTTFIVGVLFLIATLSTRGAGDAELFGALSRTLTASNALALAQRGAPALPYLRDGLSQGGRLAALCAWSLQQYPQAGGFSRATGPALAGGPSRRLLGRKSTGKSPFRRKRYGPRQAVAG